MYVCVCVCVCRSRRVWYEGSGRASSYSETLSTPLGIYLVIQWYIYLFGIYVEITAQLIITQQKVKNKKTWKLKKNWKT